MGKKLSELKKATLKAHIFQILFMLMMLFFMVIPVYRNTSEKYVKCDTYVMDDGWNVTVRNVLYNNQTLSNFFFDIANKDDVIIMEKEIPEDVDIPNAVLNVYTVHSTLDVFIDGLPIYSYGWNLKEQNLLLGYGDHYIDLPEGYQGGKLTIYMTVTEDSAFDGIQAVDIMDGHRYISQGLAGKRINLLIACFLMMFGALAMVLSILMIRGSSDFTQTYCIAMFSFLIGCWTFCNSDLITYFISDLRVKVYIEYVTLYVVTVPFTFYFKKIVDKKTTPTWLKIFFWGTITLEIIVAAAAYICQQLNIAHYPVFLPYCHMVMGLAALFIIVCEVVDVVASIKEKQKVQLNFIIFGFGIALLEIIFELVKYNFGKYFIGFEGNQYNSSVSVAILIIVVSMLIDFALGVSRNLFASAKQQLLEQMAYMDELTGLSNRRMCEETLEEYKDQNKKYSVISLDLNLLKHVNDTMGHDMGDAMLRKFADCLREVFEMYGTIGRMGGDEFIVILPHMDIRETEELASDLKEAMFKENLKDDKLKLSTAYGIAVSDEVPVDSDAHAAYRLADERMYENKRISKLGRT